jgi:succinate dehydrogenase / fumarate reductase cytochrome b subunit
MTLFLPAIPSNRIQLMASATTGLRHPKGPPTTKPERGATPYFQALLDSSVGSKIIVALTGIGLVLFVIFHMIGNLKMFQGWEAVNGYAYFLKHDLGLLIWIARGGLLAIFILHLGLAIRLYFRSRAARPIAYQYPGSVQATVASRTMIWSGIVIGLFTLFHLAHFTFGWVKEVETAPGVYTNYLELRDPKGHHDVYSMVVAGFRNPVIAALYVIAQIALFLHLSHGIQSSFQTLGLKNRRFAAAIRVFGLAVAATILVGNVGLVLAVQTGRLPAAAWVK